MDPVEKAGDSSEKRRRRRKNKAKVSADRVETPGRLRGWAEAEGERGVPGGVEVWVDRSNVQNLKGRTPLLNCPRMLTIRSKGRRWAKTFSSQNKYRIDNQGSTPAGRVSTGGIGLVGHVISVDEIRVVAYPLRMMLLVFPERLTRLWPALVCAVADSAFVAEGREKVESAELEDIRRSRQGDSDAYRRLIERHQAHVSRILWRFSRDRLVHEELVQDVFVEAYMSLGSYRAKAPFEHWLARIATRVGYRYWKQIARRKEKESFSLEEWDQMPDESSERIDPSVAASLVHRLLAQLRPRDRLVLTLRYLEGCNVAETARRTGWTKSMVKVQSGRAIKRLEKLVGRPGEELLE